MTFKNFCWQIFKPYRYHIALMMLAGVLWGFYLSFSPYLLKVIIDELAQGKKIQAILVPAYAYVFLYFLATLNFRALDWIKYKILPPIKQDIALCMFNYLKHHSHDFFQNRFAGAISNKVNDMVTSLDALLGSFDEFFTNLAAFLIAIGVMYSVNPMFSLALFIWCVVFFGLSLHFSQTILQLSNATSAAYSIYAGTLVDVLSNISSVRLFARFNFETNKIKNDIADLVAKDKRMLRYIINMRLVQDATLVALLSMMIALLLYFYQHSIVSIGDFALILTITMSIFQGMWHLASRIIDVYKSLGRCAQAMSLLEISHEVVDDINATQLMVNQGCIEYKCVNFAYKNGPEIFNGLNLKIEPGTKVGLVGFSGSGKSTFINLLLRLYDIQQGEILIDGQNIAQATQNSLHQQISMIPQDISLFHRSLLENIRYGKPEANFEEVIDASSKAHCHDFICQLEHGYETLVGERGIKLSGGQRQRIAIARAFLENAPILVLDEATSSLDSVTEKYIQDSLRLAIQQRTTLVIAHRLSTLLEMDHILVFDKGQIIEQGTHQHLIAQNGHYAKMWHLQSNGFLPT